jgi:hypothetical protein
MSRTMIRLVGLLAILTLGLAGCSSGGEEEGGGTEACNGSAISSDQIKLPADFPMPPEVTVTDATSAGPSRIVDGYFDADLQEAYDDFHRQLDTAGYAVLFDEIEDKDAEISYKSADESSTGQIALKSECSESDKTVVHITNRPS